LTRNPNFRIKIMQYNYLWGVFFWHSPPQNAWLWTCVITRPKTIQYNQFWGELFWLSAPNLEHYIFKLSLSQDQKSCNIIISKVQIFGLHHQRMPNFVLATSRKNGFFDQEI
jgi:hypothetical protein